ncbi:two pore domain potassium channel family protein [Nocardia amamiensis]|uniref:Two pore domain potassium channel family protein n=1 Tax=Nocardia amamiensis TaxID=404578 RepID=A0ABS0CQK1_9NOCA|nr:potassium channel family protein [Nocardia amamiensis]MBF6298899.1 two pore domain potassium channel family protein [Nocardia amamiensis]
MSTANGSHSGSAGDRRWVLRRALLPPTITITALLLAYFSLPFTRISGMHTLLILLLGLVAVCAVGAWQIRQVLRAVDPVAQALQALAATFGLYLVGYATVYAVLSDAAPGDFSEPLTRLDALYFCATVFTTVGFGDIVATSQTSRAVVLSQMLANLVLIGLVLRLLILSVRLRREQLHRSHPFSTGNSEEK